MGTVGLEKEDLCHTFSAEEIQEGIRTPLPETGKYIEVSSFSYDPKMEIPRKFYTKWFDYDKIKNAIQLRYRRKGDYLTVTASVVASHYRIILSTKRYPGGNVIGFRFYAMATM